MSFLEKDSKVFCFVFFFFFLYGSVTSFFYTFLYTQKIKVVLEEKVHIMLNNMIF